MRVTVWDSSEVWRGFSELPRTLQPRQDGHECWRPGLLHGLPLVGASQEDSPPSPSAFTSGRRWLCSFNPFHPPNEGVFLWNSHEKYFTMHDYELETHLQCQRNKVYWEVNEVASLHSREEQRSQESRKHNTCRKRPELIPGAQTTRSWTSSDTERLNLPWEGVYQTLELDDVCLCLLDLESISMSRNILVGMTWFLKATELQQSQDLGTFSMLDLNGFIVGFEEDARI